MQHASRFCFIQVKDGRSHMQAAKRCNVKRTEKEQCHSQLCKLYQRGGKVWSAAGEGARLWSCRPQTGLETALLLLPDERMPREHELENAQPYITREDVFTVVMYFNIISSISFMLTQDEGLLLSLVVN